MKNYCIITLLVLFFSSAPSILLSQELNTRFTLISNKIQSVDVETVKQIEEAIKTLLNEKVWSNVPFERDERIDCSITMTLTSMTGNTYGADIQITSRRPIYNASYESPMINWKDAKCDFTYALGQTLDYNEISLTSNLVAVIAYYVNIIAGLDFDSFSPNGGRTYFANAMNIANMAQTIGAKGWEPFDGRSRYDLALALTEESSKSFHTQWYNYHRLGLDEMTSNITRGRIRILETLTDLEVLQKARPNSVLLTLFADTKLDEFVKVCSQATAEEKKDAKERLQKLFPSRRKAIEDGMK